MIMLTPEADAHRRTLATTLVCLDTLILALT